MRKIVVTMVLAVLCSLCVGLQVGQAAVPTSGSDVVRLTDGQIIVGELVRFDGDVFEIETNEETLYIKRGDVVGIFVGAPELVAMDEYSQWAATARASSEYSDTGWSAGQATGEPNTEKCGDINTAWAPRTSGEGEEWLELSFSVPVFATGVRVHETFNAGFVFRIDLIDEGGQLHTIWQGKDGTSCPGWLQVSFERTSYKVALLRIYTRIKGWEEIDAVQLVGYRQTGSALSEDETGRGHHDKGAWQESDENASAEQTSDVLFEGTLSVGEFLRQKDTIGNREVQVRGLAEDVEQEKGIFGTDYTSFDLVGEDGSSLIIQLDHTVEGIPADKQVVVTGRLERLFGDFIEFFSASDIAW